MNKKLLLLAALALSVTFYSCKNDNDDVSTSSTPTITTGGLLRGTVNYTLDGNDSIKVWNYDGSLGTGKTAADGSFSVQVGTPTTLYNYGTYKGVNISDTTVQVAYAFVNAKSTGGDYYLFRENFKTAIQPTGVIESHFWYVDRDVTMKGRYLYASYRVLDPGATTLTKTPYLEDITYNLSLKKGWNELVFKISKNEYDAKDSVVYRAEYTSTIPDGLKWYRIDE